MRATTAMSATTGRISCGLVLLAAAALIGQAVVADDSGTGGPPADRLASLGCEVEDRGVSQPADRDGRPYDVRTHACTVDGDPIAFHFEFLTEPTVHQVGAFDDPDGGSLAVSGDGWRIHLVGEHRDDQTMAGELAAATDGEVGRLLTAFVCRIRHPGDEL